MEVKYSGWLLENNTFGKVQLSWVSYYSLCVREVNEPVFIRAIGDLCFYYCIAHFVLSCQYGTAPI